MSDLDLIGPPPDGFTASEWKHVTFTAAKAIAEAQSVTNQGTPEEYGAAALRAAMPWLARHLRANEAAR